jgi:hypothetical protein
VKPETIAGLTLVAVAAFGVATDTRSLDRPAPERALNMLKLDWWPGWATVAGVGLLYVGTRGVRK